MASQLVLTGNFQGLPYVGEDLAQEAVQVQPARIAGPQDESVSFIEVYPVSFCIFTLIDVEFRVSI